MARSKNKSEKSVSSSSDKEDDSTSRSTSSSRSNRRRKNKRRDRSSSRSSTSSSCSTSSRRSSRSEKKSKKRTTKKEKVTVPMKNKRKTASTAENPSRSQQICSKRHAASTLKQHSCSKSTAPEIIRTRKSTCSACSSQVYDPNYATLAGMAPEVIAGGKRVTPKDIVRMNEERDRIIRECVVINRPKKPESPASDVKKENGTPMKAPAYPNDVSVIQNSTRKVERVAPAGSSSEECSSSSKSVSAVKKNPSNPVDISK